MAYTCSGCGGPGRITTCKACRARRLARGFVLWFAKDGQPLSRVGRFVTLEAARNAATMTYGQAVAWYEPGIDYAGWSARIGGGTVLVLQESPADVTGPWASAPVSTASSPLPLQPISSC